MKYKLIGIVSAILLIVIAFASTSYEPAVNRYHQHLEAQEKAPCTNHGEDVFCTHLPLLSIDTEQPIPDPFVYEADGSIRRGTNNRSVTNNLMVHSSIKLFDSETENNHLTDTPSFSENGLIRIRGNTSRQFDKKSYLLKITEDNFVDNKDIPLAGMTADSEWTLHGPFWDKTLLRNYLCYNLGGEIMDYSPNVRFCELFLNGEYQGVYLITEKINYNEKGRVQLTKTDPKMPETSYILRLDDGITDSAHQLVTFADNYGKRGISTRRYEHFQILYPNSTLTEEQKAFITQDISRFEKVLTSFDFNHPDKGYASYIDVDSFVKYFVFNEFTMNADAGKISTYYYKDIRGKIGMIGWDYNSTFNNYRNDLSNPQRFYIYNYWFDQLCRDEAFVEEVIRTYHELRETTLSDDYIFQYIDDTVAYLGPAIDRNFEKWGYTFNQVLLEEDPESPSEAVRNPQSYEEAIQSLKTTIAERGAFLDENIEALRTRCHPSTTKKYKYQGDE